MHYRVAGFWRRTAAALVDGHRRSLLSPGGGEPLVDRTDRADRADEVSEREGREGENEAGINRREEQPIYENSEIDVDSEIIPLERVTDRARDDGLLA